MMINGILYYPSGLFSIILLTDKKVRNTQKLIILPTNDSVFFPINYPIIEINYFFIYLFNCGDKCS